MVDHVRDRMASSWHSASVAFTSTASKWEQLHTMQRMRTTALRVSSAARQLRQLIPFTHVYGCLQVEGSTVRQWKLMLGLVYPSERVMDPNQ